MIRFKTHSDEAVIPSKAGPNEIGFDLTITRIVKEFTYEKIVNFHNIFNIHYTKKSNTKMYDTDISIEPSKDIYLEIVPRSSLSKTGYILTNSVGIIDPTYRGTLKVVLTKIESGAPELELPCKKFQLIPRSIVKVDVEVVDKNVELSDTARGDGGFGSTD